MLLKRGDASGLHWMAPTRKWNDTWSREEGGKRPFNEPVKVLKERERGGRGGRGEGDERAPLSFYPAGDSCWLEPGACVTIRLGSIAGNRDPGESLVCKLPWRAVWMMHGTPNAEGV